MSLPDILLNLSAFSLVWILPIAVLLTRVAMQRPHYWALTLFALLTVGIALLEAAYIAAATNAFLGYPIPKEVAQVGFRLSALVVAMFPPIFWWVYKTGRFRDGGAK